MAESLKTRLEFRTKINTQNSVSLTELQEYRGRLGVGIERDLHFRPTPLSKLRRD